MRIATIIIAVFLMAQSACEDERLEPDLNKTMEGLHAAIPNHLGDWYFTGNYPTPGGNKVVNKSFIYYFEGKDERAY